jgi:hypothetical protein
MINGLQMMFPRRAAEESTGGPSPHGVIQPSDSSLRSRMTNRGSSSV